MIIKESKTLLTSKHLRFVLKNVKKVINCSKNSLSDNSEIQITYQDIGTYIFPSFFDNVVVSFIVVLIMLSHLFSYCRFI